MNKKIILILLDFGSSKIRFSVFDNNLNEKFSKMFLFHKLNDNNLKIILKKLIKL